jgi:hypothetical protein
VLRFYWRLVKRTPVLLWHALTGLDTIIGVLALAFGAVGLSTWQQLLPWWSPFAAFGAILIYGFLRANYEEHLAVEEERDDLKRQLAAKEERATIEAALQRLYGEGAALRAEMRNSTDVSLIGALQERFDRWQEDVGNYLAENVSVGKAQYVCGVLSLNAAYIRGVHQALHNDVRALEARLERLAEVMRDY